MSLFARKKGRQPPTLTREQALSCTPVQNNVLSWVRLESGLVRIEYTLTLKPFFSSVLKRFHGRPEHPQVSKRTLELDELGSQVWEMVDGSRTTAEIIDSFANHHAITCQEAEQAITAFFRGLGKRGLIAMR
jgi:hypothetical protein